MSRQSAEVRNSTASFNAQAKTVASHSDWGCGAFRCPRRLSFANSASPAFCLAGMPEGEQRLLHQRRCTKSSLPPSP